MGLHAQEGQFLIGREAKRELVGVHQVRLHEELRRAIQVRERNEDRVKRKRDLKMRKRDTAHKEGDSAVWFFV